MESGDSSSAQTSEAAFLDQRARNATIVQTEAPRLI